MDFCTMALTATVNNIFAIEMCVTFIRPPERAKIKCKYANRKPIRDFLYTGNGNIYPICHYLRYIRNENMHDFDL